MTLDPDYSLEEVAEAIGMSTRWIRDRIRDGKTGKGPAVAHIRYGHVIKFTADQVELLRAAHIKAPEPAAQQSITTGRKRAS